MALFYRVDTLVFPRVVGFGAAGCSMPSQNRRPYGPVTHGPLGVSAQPESNKIIAIRATAINPAIPNFPAIFVNLHIISHFLSVMMSPRRLTMLRWVLVILKLLSNGYGLAIVRVAMLRIFLNIRRLEYNARLMLIRVSY